MEKESKEKLIEEVERYSEDEEIYDMYKYHSKQELIQNSLIDEARLEGIEEVAKNLLSMNMSIQDISKATGLSIDDINNLSGE